MNPAFFRNEEEKYHASGHTVFEKVAGEIRETLVAADRIRAEYPLQVVLIKPDTSWTKGVSDVTLEIQVTPNGPRIVKQNSVSRERGKIKGRGAPSFALIMGWFGTFGFWRRKKPEMLEDPKGLYIETPISTDEFYRAVENEFAVKKVPVDAAHS